MKTSAFTRILALLLTLLMLASFLVACKTEEAAPTEAQTSTEAVPPSGSDPRQLIYNCTLNGIGWSSQWESLGTGVRDSFSDILSLYGLVY